jgi:uncharacterized protein
MQDAFAGPISGLLVKVAARCNINCSYCYWFRDPSVYAKPKLMSEAVTQQLLRRVEEHILATGLASFSIILHGGEPLLWGVGNFHRLAEACQEITRRTGCAIPLSLTTNGVLVNEAWLDCFEAHDIAVTVSIDGPADIHDANRRTFQGGGTHAAAERALRLLQLRNIQHGVLAVGNPARDPADYVEHFTDLGLSGFDILIPDATWEDKPPSVAGFYRALFDIWMEANSDRHRLSIRVIDEMLVGLLGGQSASQGVGYGPIELCTVLTDGAMEPLDVLRIAGEASTRTAFSIFDNAIEEVKQEPRWQAARHASLNLAAKCRSCKFMAACGGGYLPHRFSKQNGYDNPSVYCDDLYSIFSHMAEGLGKHLYAGQASLADCAMAPL